MVGELGGFGLAALEKSSGALSRLPVELDQMIFEERCLHGVLHKIHSVCGSPCVVLRRTVGMTGER